ncbi:MAG TPA: VOC family protein [Rhizomicrobium sp.]|nr:VOC family protein [Rhizomicrobium sp.]
MSAIRFAKAGVDVGIVVADAPAQCHFYGEVLGLPKMGEVQLPNGTLHIFRCGNSLLKLYALSGASRGSPAGEFGAHTGIAYVTLDVENLEEVLPSLENAGVTILTPLSQFDAGVELPEPVGRVQASFAMIADPEGNRIELLQRHRVGAAN